MKCDCDDCTLWIVKWWELVFMRHHEMLHYIKYIYILNVDWMGIVDCWNDIYGYLNLLNECELCVYDHINDV